jgi:hypothetical protein
VTLSGYSGARIDGGKTQSFGPTLQNNSRMENLTIQNFLLAGALITGADTATIQNCKFLTTGERGVVVTDDAQLTIVGDLDATGFPTDPPACEISGSSQSGVYVPNATPQGRVLITGCSIHDNPGHGIYAYGGNVETHSTYITANGASVNEGSGLYIDGGTKAYLESTRIKDHVGLGINMRDLNQTGTTSLTISGPSVLDGNGLLSATGGNCGGIWLRDNTGPLTITPGTVIANGQCSGIYRDGVTNIDLNGVIVSSVGSAQIQGGLVFLGGGQVTMNDTQVTNNSSTNGIYIAPTVDGAGFNLGTVTAASNGGNGVHVEGQLKTNISAVGCTFDSNTFSGVAMNAVNSTITLATGTASNNGTTGVTASGGIVGIYLGSLESNGVNGDPTFGAGLRLEGSSTAYVAQGPVFRANKRYGIHLAKSNLGGSPTLYLYNGGAAGDPRTQFIENVSAGVRADAGEVSIAYAYFLDNPPEMLNAPDAGGYVDARPPFGMSPATIADTIFEFGTDGVITSQQFAGTTTTQSGQPFGNSGRRPWVDLSGAPIMFQ